jgi:hypothetical protein
MYQKIISLFVALMGSIFLVLTVPGIVRSIQLKKSGASAESTVISSERIRNSKGPSTYKVKVSFNVSDGNAVSAEARKRNSVSVGDKVKIYYDPATPQRIDFGDSIGYDMRGAVVGGLFLLLGIFLFIKDLISGNARSKLISSGMKIAAEFVSIERDERFRAGDNNPWIIKCRWVDNGNNQEYFFMSKTYTIDPAPYLNGRYKIDVFVNPADPSKYYMDTSFMPKGNNTIG